MTDKGLVPKIHKHLMTPNSIETNNPLKKWAQDLWKHFYKDIQMAIRHMKRCPTTLIIREMQIKTTMTYHFTSVRTAIIKKPTRNAGEGVEREGNPPTLWWECQSVQPLWRTERRFLRKLKIELSYDPAIPLMCIHPEKNTIGKETRTAMLTAALFTIAKTWRRP